MQTSQLPIPLSTTVTTIMDRIRTIQMLALHNYILGLSSLKACLVLAHLRFGMALIIADCATVSWNELETTKSKFCTYQCPHGASTDNRVSNLEQGFCSLERGVEVNIGHRVVTIKAFPIQLTSDMPQRADNSGFYRHNAIQGCTACFAKKDEWGGYDYPVVEHGRYHFDTIFLRDSTSPFIRLPKRIFDREYGIRNTLQFTGADQLLFSQYYELGHNT